MGATRSDHGPTGPDDRYADLGELLNDVAHGDVSAFSTVYERLAAPVYGLALRVVRDTAQAEDVTQETLINVWRAAGRYDPARGSAIAWVMTLTHRRAVDRIRSEQAYLRRNAHLCNTEDRPYDYVADLVELRFQHASVRRCITSLTDLQLEVIHLTYYEGHSHQEAARILGVPLGTIKSRIHQALARLRAALAPDD